MADFDTTWFVNGIEIKIESTFVGDEEAPWGNPRNCNRNIIGIYANGEYEEFDAWGSIVNPEFTTEYDLKNIFQNICELPLQLIWGQLEDYIDEFDYDFKEGKRIEKAAIEQAEKLDNLGLYDEDILEQIVNDEEWR